MKIFVKEHSSDNSLFDNIDSPWHEFFMELRENGFEFTETLDDASCLISNNAPSQKFFRRISHIPRNRRTLILWESPKIKPSNYTSKIGQEFDLHLSPSREWLAFIKNENVELFNWPHTNPQKIAEYFEEKTDRSAKFIMLSGNNFSNSNQENYSLRRKLAITLKENIDLWGRDWEMRFHLKLGKIVLEIFRTRKFPNISSILNFLRGVPWNKGYVTNKFGLMSKYSFGIVIENSSDYVSEKLIDTIISGVAPIYVGPDLVSHGYPAGICIQVGGKLDEIEAAMTRIRADERLYGEILKSGREFLSSREFSEMINSFVLRRLARQSTFEWQESLNEDRTK